MAKLCSASSVKNILSRCVPKSSLPSHLQSKNPVAARRNCSPVLLISSTAPLPTVKIYFSKPYGKSCLRIYFSPDVSRIRLKESKKNSKGKKKKKNLDEVEEKTAVERKGKTLNFSAALGALTWGSQRLSGRSWQLPGQSALLEVCDRSEGRDLPPEVISFLRWCAGVCDGRFLFTVF